MITTVPNPEDKCTYFEQFCIDDKIFRLGIFFLRLVLILTILILILTGDFVCVRSDQVQPFIARIDRMWTDSEYVPFIYHPVIH